MYWARPDLEKVTLPSSLVMLVWPLRLCLTVPEATNNTTQQAPAASMTTTRLLVLWTSAVLCCPALPSDVSFHPVMSFIMWVGVAM
jgi:hypothetical protein